LANNTGVQEQHLKFLRELKEKKFLKIFLKKILDKRKKNYSKIFFYDSPEFFFFKESFQVNFNKI